MVSSCCVLGCENRRVRAGTALSRRLRFYRFPKKDKERRALWLKALKRDDWEPTPFSRICSEHFVFGDKSDNKLSPNFTPCIFQHTTPAEKRRLHKQYDAFSKEIAQTVEKINSATVMLSIVEQELAASWRSNPRANRIDNSGRNISDKSADDEPEAPYDGTALNDHKNDSSLERDVEHTVEVDELLMKYSKRRSDCIRIDHSTQTEVVHDYIKGLEIECSNLRSELVFFKGKFVFKDIKLETFQDNDDKVRYLTGLGSYSMLKVLSNTLSAHQTKVYKVTGFQQLLMTLMRMKLNLSISFLGIMFDIDWNTVSQLFICTIELLFCKLVPRVIFWPSSDDMRKVLPSEFGDCKNCLYLVDCFELQLQTVSDTPSYKCLESDNKLPPSSGNKFQIVRYFLTIAPQGSIIFISKGRSEEVNNRTVALESGFFENIRPGDLIVIERELDIDDEVDIRGATIKMASSVKSRVLSETEEEGSRGLVRIKWVTHLMKQKYQILEGKVPPDWVKSVEKGELTILDKIVHVSCAFSNMANKVWTYEKLLTQDHSEESVEIKTELY